MCGEKIEIKTREENGREGELVGRRAKRKKGAGRRTGVKKKKGTARREECLSEKKE